MATMSGTIAGTPAVLNNTVSITGTNFGTSAPGSTVVVNIGDANSNGNAAQTVNVPSVEADFFSNLTNCTINDWGFEAGMDKSFDLGEVGGASIKVSITLEDIGNAPGTPSEDWSFDVDPSKVTFTNT